MSPDSGTKGLNFAILASAGTGKTYQLSVRLARLLMLGKRPEEIIALTFTRAAAGEFYLRVLQRLKEAATDETKRRAICGVHPAGEPSPVDQNNPLVLKLEDYPPAAFAARIPSRTCPWWPQRVMVLKRCASSESSETLMRLMPAFTSSSA